MNTSTPDEPPGKRSGKPFGTWQVASFDGVGAVEIKDSAPHNSGFGELTKTVLILPSLLFPGGPHEAFFKTLNQIGHRVICVRRRGFGLTTAGDGPDHEVSLIEQLISYLSLQHVRCLALGSSAPLALRLYETVDQIRSVDFVNIASAAVPDNAIQNKFLKKMVLQSLVGVAGAHMVVGAIKWQIRRNGPLEFAKSLYDPSVEDIRFLEDHPGLLWDAYTSMSGINPRCVRDELVAAFVRNHEPVIKPEKEGFSIFTGPDVPDVFQANALAFSNKCAAELRRFSKGGILSVYICADEYADFIRTRSGSSAV